MSRIHAGECEYMDMEWYGVDRQGNVAVFCSGGVGNLPEFVCENHERAYELIDYFEMLEKMTSSVLMFPKAKVRNNVRETFLIKDCIISMQMMEQNRVSALFTNIIQNSLVLSSH